MHRYRRRNLSSLLSARPLIALLAVHAFAISALAGTTCAHSDTVLRCVKYHHNYDGDTVTVDVPNVHPLFGKQISVRIQGIDTPEMRGETECEREKAIKARNRIQSLLKKAKRIDLVDLGRDKYFRILADVVVDGRDLRPILISEKLAYPYDGGKKLQVDWCEDDLRK